MLLNWRKNFSLSLELKVDGIFVLSTTLILTFNKPGLPDHIWCSFFNLQVRQYVPNPLCCFKCQRLDILRSTGYLNLLGALLWSEGNIVSSHLVVPGSISGRVSFPG